MAGDPAADRQALVEVINLGLLWHCLCAITRLEVPERLAAGPLPVPQLAAAVGADQDALWRVLRLVADHHIVTLEGDRVGLTDRGRLLCRDHPSSLQAAFATVGTADVAHGLTDTLRTGQPAAPGCWAWATGTIWPPTPTSRRCSTRRWSSGPRCCRWPVCRCWTGPPQPRSPTSPGGPAPCSRPCSRPPRTPAASSSTSPRCWSAPGPFLERRGVADRCAAVPRGPVRPATPGRPVSAGQRAARLGRRPRGPHLGGAGPQRHPRHPPADLRDAAARPTPPRTGPG